MSNAVIAVGGGSGTLNEISEGFVFTDKKNIFKLIDKSQQPLELYWTLLSLSETLKNGNSSNAFPQFCFGFFA